MIALKKLNILTEYLEFNSLGLSLIDDRNQKEILYVSITSSSVNWGEIQTKKNNSFKLFPMHRIEKLEQAYLKFINERPQLTSPIASNYNEHTLIKEFSYKTIPIDDQDEVDFERMVLYSGKDEIPIERHFAPSLYVNYFSSLSQTTLHIIIHKLQIDNQLYDCVFPVMFSKVLPPKSVASSSTIVKPIIELSMVQYSCQKTKTTEMKYFKILMQEFFVKFDIVCLNALSVFLTEKTDTTSNKKYFLDSSEFYKEMHDVKKSFHELFTSSNIISNQQKNDKIYFDILHISPIKIHLSFSLSGADAFKDANIFLDNPFIKSIGLVLTDMQDVVFK